VSTIDSLSLIRLLEYAVFGGVTESPESMFERDVHANTTDRETGRALGPVVDRLPDEQLPPLGRLYFDAESRRAFFEVSSPEV
jgi:hypothetical protein